MQKVLITGSAGFIGFHLTKRLLKDGFNVIGIDNLNNYYDKKLKFERQNALNKFIENSYLENSFSFQEIDISNKKSLKKIFNENDFEVVINLAAQAGVRYSLDNPDAYIDSNLKGFVNILECCRYASLKHLIFASSSSVYGMNTKQPFSVKDNTDHPISLYAASKKANELMAHSYSHLFNIPSTGLRFFTVYGPFGRPDMAYYKFTKAINDGKVIDIYNNGNMKRDFTYIDDIVEGISRVIPKPPLSNNIEITNSNAPFKILNIGNNKPITLQEFIESIEAALSKKSIKNNLPMQPGDVPITYADITELVNDYGFNPKTDIQEGIKSFVEWYLEYESNK